MLKQEHRISIEEFVIKQDGRKIYGKLYKPTETGIYPVVIFSHGYNGNHMDFEKDCEFFAENGFVAYAFDFCGGSNTSKSSGSSTDMTIFTEQDDLCAVLYHIRELDCIDKERICLLGGSQGGLVTALASEKCQNDVAAMVLYYPAFHIPEVWRGNFQTEDDIPEKLKFWGLTLGAGFFKSMRSFHTFENIGGFDKPVLIVHGDCDEIVPLDIGKQAQKHYPDAKLLILSGEGHGFTPKGSQKARESVFSFLKDL